MAKALEEYLTCPVCSDTLREPVSLGCHHSFCSVCLKDYWDQNNCKTCPVCRRMSSKRFPGINFALKELGITFTEVQKAKKQAQVEVVCSRHPELTRLFCKDEHRTLCAVCEFTLHQQHTVVFVEEAVSELKEKLQLHLRTLQEKRDRVKTVKQTYTELQQHSEKQAEHCERQIRAVFERMHQFLKQEEESRLEDLRQEQQRQAQTMGSELERVREQLASLSNSIQALEEQLKNNSVTFIKEFSQTHNQVKEQASKPDPRLVPGLLINKAHVLGNLVNAVSLKMTRMISPYSKVLLDPNTANSSLYVSEGMTRVSFVETQPKELLNPERFTNRPAVLGSNGFSSGIHIWELFVSDCPTWDIGVAKESVDRRGEIFAKPEYGLWCLCHSNGTYNNGDINHILTVTNPPVKIRVQLDFNQGLVYFFDGNTLLYTHKDKFTEKLFPYISLGSGAGAKTKEIKFT